jgi:hypothetical protein
MPARGAWAQSPRGSLVLPPTPVGQIPSPIPGDPARFTYAAQMGAYPWASASWAGGFPLAAYPGGGVLITPDPVNGVMMVRAWWPYTTSLQLVRIDMDGTRTPVRGGYPLRVTTDTRRNAVTNPSIEAGTNGYLPDVGTPTLTQLATPDAPSGAFVLRATNASSGSSGVTVPTSLTPPPLGLPVTVGGAIRTSALASSVTVSIGWTDSTGGTLTSNTATLTADQRAAAVSQFTRFTATVTTPSDAVTPTLKITAGGMPAGGTMDLDALTFEVGATTGTAFDGSTLGGSWLGAVNLSASVLAPVYTLLDGECPLDTLVRYEVLAPTITGGRVTSDPAVLESNRRVWLTHPGNPSQPLQVDLREKPVRDYPIQQGKFRPMNRRYAVVVSNASRQGAEGEIKFNVLSMDHRERLLAMLEDGSPLLLRSPEDYHFDTGWLSLETVKDDPEGRLAYQDAWLISAPFTEVEAPSALI